MPTLLHRLARWAEKHPDMPAQSYLTKSGWKDLSAKEYCDRVFHLALFLESRGFKKGDASVIYSYNTPEWVQMDLAPGLLKGLSAGIYPNSTQKDIQYVVDHTGAKVLAVQNADYFKRMGYGAKESLPSHIELILVFEGATDFSPKAVSYGHAIAEGKKLAKGKKIWDYLENVDRHAGAFLIYTSGTTGNPKGALLSHDNLVFAGDVAISHWAIPPNGKIFSFLPLCHVAEKMQNLAVGISVQCQVYFSSKFENVSKELVQVQPTLLLSVPRLWEKMVEQAKIKIKDSPPIKQNLAEWALGVGKRVSEAKLAGKFPALKDLAQYPIADRLVLANVRKAMGLANVTQAASGAAALAAPVARWFRSIGVEILEDYGQTESTGIICMTIPGVDCAGTVGKPVPGTEFKIADDGEILAKGRHVFVGYYKNEQATNETVKDGWLHTGDLAEITDKGLVRIKGRKKEILKTSGGKMVAPAPIEDELKDSQVINQACMVGDNRKYLTMLVTISESLAQGFRARAGAVQNGVIRDAEANALVKRELDELNKKLASYEKIKQFRVLDREFTIESGELTPTLKMKRAVIEKKYADVINEMYSSSES